MKEKFKKLHRFKHEVISTRRRTYLAEGDNQRIFELDYTRYTSTDPIDNKYTYIEIHSLTTLPSDTDRTKNYDLTTETNYDYVALPLGTSTDDYEYILVFTYGALFSYKLLKVPTCFFKYTQDKNLRCQSYALSLATTKSLLTSRPLVPNEIAKRTMHFSRDYIDIISDSELDLLQSKSLFDSEDAVFTYIEEPFERALIRARNSLTEGIVDIPVFKDSNNVTFSYRLQSDTADTVFLDISKIEKSEFLCEFDGKSNTVVLLNTTLSDVLDRELLVFADKLVIPTKLSELQGLSERQRNILNLYLCNDAISKYFLISLDEILASPESFETMLKILTDIRSYADLVQQSIHFLFSNEQIPTVLGMLYPTEMYLMSIDYNMLMNYTREERLTKLAFDITALTNRQLLQISHTAFTGSTNKTEQLSRTITTCLKFFHEDLEGDNSR